MPTQWEERIRVESWRELQIIASGQTDTESSTLPIILTWLSCDMTKPIAPGSTEHGRQTERCPVLSHFFLKVKITSSNPFWAEPVKVREG
jgi:hypothetical protein